MHTFLVRTIKSIDTKVVVSFLYSFWGVLLTLLNEGATFHLNQSSIRPSIYFSSIVKSRSNQFLEPTVCCSMKQLDPLVGFKHVTYCATPPLSCFVVGILFHECIICTMQYVYLLFSACIFISSGA